MCKCPIPVFLRTTERILWFNFAVAVRNKVVTVQRDKRLRLSFKLRKVKMKISRLEKTRKGNSKIHNRFIFLEK